MKKTALIMAGGRGERFWPKSRKNLPKQFLSLTEDGKTMIQLTVERILPIVSMEDIYIATSKQYQDLVFEQLPDIPKENILLEPVGRNTAPCIGFGALHIAKKLEDAIMIVLSSDHLIKSKEMFLETLNRAAKKAEEQNSLVTIGIKPNYPEVGYGYIKIQRTSDKEQSFRVEQFVEKPDIETAKKYVASSDYLWNSGMFVWKVSTILDNIKSFLPEMYQGLIKIGDSIGTPEYDLVLKEEFPKLESESIDFGVMEKAEYIDVYPGEFGWDDVGSWLALERLHTKNDEGNVVQGFHIGYNTQNCIIEGCDKLIATVGLKDVVIVDTPDVTLVCDKNHSADIKKVIEILKDRGEMGYI